MPRINIPTVGEVDFPDGMSDDAISAAIQKNYPQLSKPAPSSNTDVAINAANKGVAALPDSILNAPNNVLNLLKAGAGTVATAAGYPNLAPSLTPNPDLARRAMESIGMIKPGILPQGGFQRGIDAVTQGVVGGALTGGASVPQAVVGAGVGGLSGGAVAATEAMDGSPAMQATAGLLAPRAARAGARVAEPVVSNVLGFTTGAGAPSIREAAKAGRAGGDKAAAFQEQLRGTAPINDVVATAKEAVSKLRQDRSDSYRQNIDVVKQDKTVLDFSTIDKAVSSVKNMGLYNGKVVNPSANETWKKIDGLVEDWKTSDPAKFHTPEGLDALKKAVGDVRDSSEYGTPARRVADQVYHAVKNEIVSQAPQYSKVMKDYEVASDLLKEMEKTLSLNPKANVDTTVRKLQSIMRNNANTNYGRRAELGNILEQNGADTMMPQLAGQALSAITPRSLSGIGSALSGGGAALTHPMALPALALTSPRLMGEASYYSGILGRLPNAAPQTSPIVTQGILADILRRQ